jgi:integrase
MATKLTAKAIEHIQPKATRQEIADAGCPGLYLIVQPTGSKSWALRYRVAGKAAKLTLGRAIVLQRHEQAPPPTIGGPLTLAGARELATRELRRIELGADPAAERRTTTVARGRDTVAGLAEQFLDLHAKKRRPATYSQYRTILRNDVIPAWGGRSVHDIGRRDAIELVESMARERPVMANRALATLSKFFGWLVVRDVLKSSPCVGIERPATERPRERVLTDAEVAAIWTACDQLGYPYGPCIQMLILTGQRRGEVAGMRWEEVGGDTWSIGADRMKARQAHLVPL